MTFRKNESTRESQEFWAFVEKKAAATQNDRSWQRGAVTPPPRVGALPGQPDRDPRRSTARR